MSGANEDRPRPQAEQRAVSEADDGLRLDRWFRTHYPALRHGALEKLLRTGQVRVDGARAKANRRVATGDIIRIPPNVPIAAVKGGDGPSMRSPSTAPASIQARRRDAEEIARLTLYEDDAIIALNKPFGLAVQGGAKTLRHVDAMLHSLEKDGERPRLTHRLDRDTGGLLILAKTRIAAARLGGAFQRHEVEKTYWALTATAPRPRQGLIDLPIGKERAVPVGASGEPDARSPAGQERVTPGGENAKTAQTDYQIVEEAGRGPAFLALRPRTGRTHQLRVHCVAIGAPIVGDGKYGGRAAQLEGAPRGLHLFCRSMRFPHPTTGRALTLSAPLCGHMAETWAFFDFDAEARVDWPMY